MHPESQTIPSAQDFRLRGFRLARMAALAYILVIVYASLRPFTGWRMASGTFGEFLLQPWPRWITLDDILFNFAAYVPLGFLLALSLRARSAAPAAVTLACLICVALSLTLEAAQQYLPSRFASTVDLLVNGVGGTVGALLAPLFSPGQRLGRELSLLRGQRFVSGSRGDAVLVLAGLWLFTQLHAPLIMLGNGDLRGSFALPGLIAYTPVSYLLAEAGVVMLNTAGIGFLLASVARNTGSGYWRTLVLLMAGACALRTAAAALVLHTANPWNWLTPGFGLGLAAALLLLLAFVRTPRSACAALAVFTLAAAVVLVNMMPENPYRPVPAYLLAGKTGHFLDFTGMIRALSDIWPFLAILFLLISLPGYYAGDRNVSP